MSWGRMASVSREHGVRQTGAQIPPPCNAFTWGQITKCGRRACSSLPCSPPPLPSIHTCFLLSFRAQLTTLLAKCRLLRHMATLLQLAPMCAHAIVAENRDSGSVKRTWRLASTLLSARNSGPQCLNSTVIEHKIICAQMKKCK